MGNVIQSGEIRTHTVELPKHTGDHHYIEDCSSAGSSRHQSGVESDRRVRFQEAATDGRTSGNVVLVKANEGGCVSNGALEEVVIEKTSEIDYPKSLADSIRKTKSYNQERDLLWIPPEKLRPKSARPEHRMLGPLGNSYLHWLSHLERLDQMNRLHSDRLPAQCTCIPLPQPLANATQGGCVSNGALEEVVIEKNSEIDYPKSLADSIRKTKSYNQERDLLWIPPEKLRPKSARPEHRMLGPLGNSYLHWLSHLERLDQMSDESSEATEEMERSPPSTGESTLC
eukprot:sb/3467770/